MTTLRRSLAYLKENRMPYIHTTHANAYEAREVAIAEHLPAHRLAKTVVFCGDGYYAMAALPADCMIDLEMMATKLGVDRLRLASEAEVARLFPDSEVGAMPPFGKLFNLPLYLDESLADSVNIVFSAGTHRDAIHMSLADFLILEEPMIMSFTRQEALAR